MHTRPDRNDLGGTAAHVRAALDRRSRRGTPRRASRPSSSVAERWLEVDGVQVFHRETPHPRRGSRVMVHLHGFALSGRFLLPTAEQLSPEFHTVVPDLPGYRRSGRPTNPLDVTGLAHAAARVLDEKGIDGPPSSATRWAVPSSASSRTITVTGSSARSLSLRRAG